MARASEKADPASGSFFSSLLSGSRTSAVVAHQPQAEIARRRADRAAALERIADEIRDVGPVCAFDDAHAAIDRRRASVSTWLDRGTHVTAVGPFPHAAGEIEQRVLVGAERADWLRRLLDPLSAAYPPSNFASVRRPRSS